MVGENYVLATPYWKEFPAFYRHILPCLFNQRRFPARRLPYPGAPLEDVDHVVHADPVVAGHIGAPGVGNKRRPRTGSQLL